MSVSSVSSLLLQQLDSWWAELVKIQARSAEEVQVYKDLRYLIGWISPQYIPQDKTPCELCGKPTISKIGYCSVCRGFSKIRKKLLSLKLEMIQDHKLRESLEEEEPKNLSYSSCRYCGGSTHAKDLICARCAITKDKECPKCGGLILRSSVHCHKCTTPDNNAPRTKTYFILNRELGLVKIGHAIDVERRRLDLERASGVEMILLATFPDTGETEERVLLKRFSEFRITGKSSREWFTYNEKLQEFLSLKRYSQNSP